MGIFSKLFGPREDPKEWLARGAKIVDVRSPSEFASGHAPKAINVPLNTLSTLSKKIKDKDSEIIVCCASGMRSAAAKQNLDKMGYTRILNAGPWTKLRTLAGMAFLSFTLATSTACAQSTETSTQETAQGNETGFVENLNLAAFKTAQVGHILVDVRTPEEVAEGHVEGADFIDFYSDDFVAQMESKYGENKDQEVFLYCRSGGRSGKALGLLKQAGFTHVHHLLGGFNAWSVSEPFVKP
ncbi:MAG: rhodanese-like domain-containing protein [Schleiferiaceae bacterium]|nr:rhodanese-like domain-containing protein [Schleiferiaceae bacterium]